MHRSNEGAPNRGVILPCCNGQQTRTLHPTKPMYDATKQGPATTARTTAANHVTAQRTRGCAPGSHERHTTSAHSPRPGLRCDTTSVNTSASHRPARVLGAQRSAVHLMASTIM